MPSTLIGPALGAVRPEINLSTVDLPQPDGPSRVTNSPFATVRSRFERTGVPDPYCLLMSASSTCGAMNLLFMRHLRKWVGRETMDDSRRGRQLGSSGASPTM